MTRRGATRRRRARADRLRVGVEAVAGLRVAGRHRSDADVEKWLALSNDAYAAGRYADALEPTSRLVARFPLQQAYAERLARIFGKLNRPADEAAAWERFIDVSPTPIDACPAIGDAYARAGQPQKSLEALQRCVSFDPRNSEQLFFLGRAYEHAGRTADAMARYSEAAATRSVECRHPARSRPPCPSRRQVGRRETGSRRRADALSGQRRRAAAGRTRGGAAEPPAGRSGRISSARLSAAPDYVDAHIALGRVEAGAGRRAEARRHFERALELDPSRRAEIAVWLERAGGDSLMRIVWSRAIASVFWFATAGYCLLSAVPFASEQFLKPGLVPALVTFAGWHAWISLAALGACAAALAPWLRSGHGARARSSRPGRWPSCARSSRRRCRSSNRPRPPWRSPCCRSCRRCGSR